MYLKSNHFIYDDCSKEGHIIWLFNGSPDGAKAGAIFYSLIETCKVNKVEPYKYFCAMLNRIRLCNTEDDYRKLLPQFTSM